MTSTTNRTTHATLTTCFSSYTDESGAVSVKKLWLLIPFAQSGPRMFLGVVSQMTLAEALAVGLRMGYELRLDPDLHECPECGFSLSGPHDTACSMSEEGEAERELDRHMDAVSDATTKRTDAAYRNAVAVYGGGR